MRKLALPEEVLLQIEQPARYIGNEFNSVVKDKEKVALRGAFLFPDVYEIGMSHLGIQICTICLTNVRTCGVSVSIPHGRIWTA